MVERPIKKSERQAVTKTDTTPDEGSQAQSIPDEGGRDLPSPSQERSKPFRNNQDKDRDRDRDRDKGKGKGKDKGRGKGNSREDDRPAPANLALMRGPKPTKAKPPVVKESEESTANDSVSQVEPEVVSEPEAEAEAAVES